MGKALRGTAIIVLLLLVVAVAGVMLLTSLSPPTPGTRASFDALSAANGQAVAPAFSVPMEARRGAADTCAGYNLELEEGAGIQRRIGHHGEAERLLAMRQNCSTNVAPFVRSAR
jgi:hypothetical protein